MFFFRHPKPVIDDHAVAVQVVQQEAARKQAANVLVAADPQPQGESVPASGDTNESDKDQ